MYVRRNNEKRISDILWNVKKHASALPVGPRALRLAGIRNERAGEELLHRYRLSRPVKRTFDRISYFNILLLPVSLAPGISGQRSAQFPWETSGQPFRFVSFRSFVRSFVARYRAQFIFSTLLVISAAKSYLPYPPYLPYVVYRTATER